MTCTYGEYSLKKDHTSSSRQQVYNHSAAFRPLRPEGSVYSNFDWLSLNAGARTLIGLSRFHWLPSISQKYSGWTRSGRTFTTEA